MVYLQPLFQLLHPNALSVSIISLPQSGHFPTLSLEKTGLPKPLSSCLMIPTASDVKVLIISKNISFWNLPLSISDKVFSRRPVYSKSKSSFTGKFSTSFFPSSVQVKLFPFAII